MRYMLDTNICIYAMKNRPEKVLLRFKEEMNNGLCISSITLAELEYGMKHSANPIKNEQALLRFLVPLSVLPFGADAASVYGEIRAELQSKVMQALAKHKEILQVHGFYYFEKEHRVSVDVVPDISVHDEAALSSLLTNELKALVPGEEVTIVIDHNYSE